MNGFVGCIPRFIKNHAGWILTILSCGGVIATAVLVAEESPEVAAKLDEESAAKCARIHEEYRRATSTSFDENYTLPDEWWEKRKLTFGEKAKIAVPTYLPAILVGGLTMACMIGAQVFNMKQQAMLIGAYALLSQQFDQYRKEVRDEVGEEKENALFNASQQKVKELQEQVKKLEAENAPQLYSIATLPGVIFESRPEHINNVFYHMLFNMLNRGGISLEELYEHIGLPKDVYNSNEAAEYGWDSYENEITYGGASVEFELVDTERPDGKTVHIINTTVCPYKLGLDYGLTDRSPDYMYEGYDCKKAILLAQVSADADVERFEKPDIWILHIF